MKKNGFLSVLALIATVNAIVTYFYETVVVSCLAQCGSKKLKRVAPKKGK